MEIREAIKDLFKQSNDRQVEMTLETTFEDLGLDSFAVVELALNLEEKLGITFFDQELHDLNTVKDMVELIERHTI